MSKKTSPENMLGVMAAFLSLAHNELLMIDREAYRFSPSSGMGGYYKNAVIPFAFKEPYKALYHWSGRITSLNLLAYEGAAWLKQPVPAVFGIDSDQVVNNHNQNYYPHTQRTITGGTLPLAIWMLLAATPWSPLPATRLSDIALHRCYNEQLGQHIAVLPQLPANTPLPDLCAYLDRQKIVGLPRLGTIIAYVCRRTNNPFADTIAAELHQEYGQVFNLNWAQQSTAFAPLSAQQREAQTWFRSYSGTVARFCKDGDLLATLRRVVLEAAAAVQGKDGGAYYSPNALIWRIA